MVPFLWMGFNCLKAAEPLLGESLLFTTKSPKVPDTHLIHSGRMKGWVNLGTIQRFWTLDWESSTLTTRLLLYIWPTGKVLTILTKIGLSICIGSLMSYFYASIGGDLSWVGFRRIEKIPKKGIFVLFWLSFRTWFRYFQNPSYINIHIRYAPTKFGSHLSTLLGDMCQIGPRVERFPLMAKHNRSRFRSDLIIFCILYVDLSATISCRQSLI